TFLEFPGFFLIGGRRVTTSHDRRRPVRSVRAAISGHGVCDRRTSAWESDRGGGRCSNRVHARLSAIRGTWSESDGGWLAQDRHPEHLPESPVTVSAAMEILQ